jgi:hypothetical protein
MDNNGELSTYKRLYVLLQPRCEKEKRAPLASGDKPGDIHSVRPDNVDSRRMPTVTLDRHGRFFCYKPRKSVV